MPSRKCGKCHHTRCRCERIKCATCKHRKCRCVKRAACAGLQAPPPPSCIPLPIPGPPLTVTAITAAPPLLGSPDRVVTITGSNLLNALVYITNGIGQRPPREELEVNTPTSISFTLTAPTPGAYAIVVRPRNNFAICRLDQEVLSAITIT